VSESPIIERPFNTAAHSALRWWRPAACIFAISFTGVILVALMLPNRYQSHLKILVKNERANSLISAGDQTQGLVYLNDVSEAQINTEIELLNSGDLLRRVVMRCGLAALVNPRVKGKERREEIALHSLQTALAVSPAHRSDVIDVTYQSANPHQSAQVLQVLSDLYQAFHLELHGAPGSYQFFDNMWQDTSRQLIAATTELAQFKQANHIVSPPEEKTLLLQHINELQTQAAESAAGASKGRQQAETYQDSLAHLTPSIEKERRSIPNQEATEQLTSILLVLRNKLAEAETRYLPEDRAIKELETQIDQTQAAIAETRRAPAQEVASGISPIYLDAESALGRATADYAGSKAQADSLLSQLRSDHARLMRLDSITVSYDNMARRISELGSLSESYRKKRDDARLSELLDSRNLSNVAIVEQPVIEEIAASPRRGIIVALGFVWSLGLAAVAAVILDLTHRPICSPLELEEATSVMLLAELPRNATRIVSANRVPELYLAMQRTMPIYPRES
jgi:uncharacterized protein involved in exopolysaccharide biosynthesis